MVYQEQAIFNNFKVYHSLSTGDGVSEAVFQYWEAGLGAMGCLHLDLHLPVDRLVGSSTKFHFLESSWLSIDALLPERLTNKQWPFIVGEVNMKCSAKGYQFKRKLPISL